MKAMLAVLLGLAFLALGCKKNPDVASGDDAKPQPDITDDDGEEGDEYEYEPLGGGLPGDDEEEEGGGDEEEEEEGDGEEEEEEGYGEDEGDDEEW